MTCSGTRDLTSSTLGTRAEATFAFAAIQVRRGSAVAAAAGRARDGRRLRARLGAGRPPLPPGAARREAEDAARAQIAALDLEVSYDDGATWKRAVPVAALPGQTIAPWRSCSTRAPCSCCLAPVPPTRGNTVTQTMICAYSIEIVR